MSKAHKKKKSPKTRRPKGAARGSRPTARVNPGIAAAARDNVASIVGQGRVIGAGPGNPPQRLFPGRSPDPAV